jgi:hypothetical protein
MLPFMLPCFCRLNLRWLPSQLKRLPQLHSLNVTAAKLNVATLFKGMISTRGLRGAAVTMVGLDKKTQAQGLPDDIMAPLARHTGEAAGHNLYTWTTANCSNLWTCRTRPASTVDVKSWLKIT